MIRIALLLVAAAALTACSKQEAVVDPPATATAPASGPETEEVRLAAERARYSAARQSSMKDDMKAEQQRTSAMKSTSKTMSFGECVSAIQTVAQKLGAAPISIAETSDLRLVRFNTADGAVLVTSSRPDQRMVITQSK